MVVFRRRLLAGELEGLQMGLAPTRDCHYYDTVKQPCGPPLRIIVVAIPCGCQARRRILREHLQTLRCDLMPLDIPSSAHYTVHIIERIVQCNEPPVS